ncbi:hypothetical protein [Kibdelosporangium phytohabitans]|uniref:Uncharacterized protein n=1 Tax=Kibdelosporangium phytohabitans TaxID=860235 RepID=A0A0N9HTV4_9PSEU|nr:hypothetical protein [Kibdelosporangium phytohabitans]ALG08398.1 hypothetical protein AOZ06_17095 [Kibdelosporangium phytohabitans]MBE1470553.1 hypothetical protein [Kibdelosporangium phytohabitans]
MADELKRLLRGTATEQDTLGLVAVATGGLSTGDLAHLTREPEWEISDRLRTVTGRSFATRASQATGT